MENNSNLNKSSGSADMQFIRSAFPSLRDDYVFFDNAGGSQTLGLVMDKITDYYMNSNVQLGGVYSISKQARARVDEGNYHIAQTLNAEQTESVIVGSSTTALIRLFSIVIGQTLKEGDEIIITNCDHEANVSPWKDLQKQGIIIKTWTFNPSSYQLEIEDLEPLMTERTKYVAFCHTSNIFGSIHPVKAITEFVHSKGAKVFVDGVAYAPHRLIDVQDLDVDFYVYSLYKVFGPHLAVLYGKKQWLLDLPGINHNFIAPNDLPYKFQPGGQNYELSYSLSGISEYYQSVAVHHGLSETASIREKMQYAFEVFDQQEERLSKRLLDFLQSKPSVTIIGERDYAKEKRVCTIAFVVKGMHSSDINAQIHPHNIGIKTGDFYAKGIVKALQLENQGGVVRVSMAHYNSLDELEKLIKLLDKII